MRFSSLGAILPCPALAVLAVAPLVVAGCNESVRTPARGIPGAGPPAAVQPAPRSELRMIVAAEHGTDFYWRRTPVTTFFTPTEAEIDALEQQLPTFLRANAPAPRFGQPPLAQRALMYRRQYVGHVEGARRRIWGNFFCQTHGDDPDAWRKQFIGVKDGGDCYFNVEFSPDRGEIADLSVNGDG